MTVVDRQSLFSGTEAVPEHLQLNQVALGECLGAHIDGLGRDFVVTKFKGGQSNPTGHSEELLQFYRSGGYRHRREPWTRPRDVESARGTGCDSHYRQSKA